MGINHLALNLAPNLAPNLTIALISAGTDDTLEQVRAAGGDGFTVQADVGKIDDVERCLSLGR